MTESQISLILGQEGDYYAFVIGSNEELKVHHSLKEARNWRIGDFVEFIDYDQLAKEFWESRGRISYSIRNCSEVSGSSSLLKEIKTKFGLTNETIIKKLEDTILEKKFSIFTEELINRKDFNPFFDKKKIRDWLITKGVGDSHYCETLIGSTFHPFKLYAHKEKQEKEKAKPYKEIEINDQEEIKYQAFDLNSLVEKFLSRPYWDYSPYVFYDKSAKSPEKVALRANMIENNLLEEIRKYIKTNNSKTTECAFFSAVHKKINPRKKCEYEHCNEKTDFWEKFCEQHAVECVSLNCSRRTSFFKQHCRPECATHCCSVSDCNVKIGWDYSFCFKHTSYCRQCQTSKDDYCLNHKKLSKECWVNGCSTRISRDVNYCSSHEGVCLTCSMRINAGRTYCSQHNNTCSDCSTHIPLSQDYCFYHLIQRNEQQLAQTNLKSLVQQKTSLGLTNPQEVTRFTTWWNNNLATVVNGTYNYSYALWLIVYEPATRNMSEVLEKLEISSGYDRNSLTSASNKASSIRNELNGANPILAIHPSANSYCSFSDIIKEPYVIKRNLPCEYIEDSAPIILLGPGIRSFISIPTREPNKYLKPLDIVWIEKEKFGINFFHAGVYLGKNNICQIIGDPLDKKGVRITDWSNFIEGGIGKLICYHPVIPFKHYEKIAQQIAWAGDIKYREGDYHLGKRNCQHLASIVACGINYSKEAEERSGSASFLSHTSTGDPGVTIRGPVILKDEINRTNNQLGENNNQRAREIKDEYKYQVEISTRNNCQIM